MFKTITAAALAAASIATIAPAPAEARGVCYKSLAGATMNTALAGGATLGQAWQWAIEDGHASDTGRCWTMVKGWSREVRYSLPYLYRAAWGN